MPKLFGGGFFAERLCVAGRAHEAVHTQTAQSGCAAVLVGVEQYMQVIRDERASAYCPKANPGHQPRSAVLSEADADNPPALLPLRLKVASLMCTNISHGRAVASDSFSCVSMLVSRFL